MEEAKQLRDEKDRADAETEVDELKRAKAERDGCEE